MTDENALLALARVETSLANIEERLARLELLLERIALGLGVSP